MGTALRRGVCDGRVGNTGQLRFGEVVLLAQERVNVEHSREHPVEGGAAVDERPAKRTNLADARHVARNCVRPFRPFLQKFTDNVAFFINLLQAALKFTLQSSTQSRIRHFGLRSHLCRPRGSWRPSNAPLLGSCSQVTRTGLQACRGEIRGLVVLAGLVSALLAPTAGPLS